uniref:Uncharacterized protein n=2 Tax=Lutzomyia longipalpis TaxID=7200 RepID=A0A1B0EZE0_LUTLO
KRQKFASFSFSGSARIVNFLHFLHIFQNFHTMSLTPEAKERLRIVFSVAKTVFHWGFIPGVLYLAERPLHGNINEFHLNMEIMENNIMPEEVGVDDSADSAIGEEIDADEEIRSA